MVGITIPVMNHLLTFLPPETPQNMMDNNPPLTDTELDLPSTPGKSAYRQAGCVPAYAMHWSFISQPDSQDAPAR